MAEACAEPRRELTGIFPGSWIDANFYIWIGHADDQRAWSQLAEARAGARRAASGVGADRLAACPRRNPDCRRQRLVLVVRRRPFVRARFGVRRPVSAAPAERLRPAGTADSRGAVRQQHLVGAASARRRRPASSPQPWTARRPATSSGWAPALSSLVPIRGPCTEARRKVAPSRGSMCGFDRECLYIRVDSDGPMTGCWPKGMR